MIKNAMRPVHPGEILREEYLVPLNLTANALSKKLGVTASRINGIVKEERGITPEIGKPRMSEDVSIKYPELFHYTGAAGLAGIVTTGTLWATHFEFLNDQEEYRVFFEKRLPALLRRAIDAAYERVKDREDVNRTMTERGGAEAYKDALLIELTLIVSDHTRGMHEPYVLSFCASTSERVGTHGLLSQWRGYGRDGGYAIAFDTAKLEDLWRLEAETVKGMPFIMGKR